MKRLNQKTAEILIRFADKVAKNAVYTIKNPPKFPLSLTKGDRVLTVQGMGYLFTMGLVHDHERGKYRPEMQFIILDRRTDPEADPPVIAYPVLYRDDSCGVLQEGIIYQGEKIIQNDERHQTAHARFAANWLPQLRSQHYLD